MNLFPGRLLPCKQFLPHIPTSQTVGSKTTPWHLKAVYANQAINVLKSGHGGGIHLQQAGPTASTYGPMLWEHSTVT